MQIITTATAFPPHYFLQETVVEALKGQWEQGLENAAVLERLHSRTGVAGRYFSLPLEQYPPLDTWGKTNDVWIETAERLGAQAIECVLSKSGLDRRQIGAFYFVSVTGVSSPSVDARLVNRMGLSPQIKRNPIFGLGCVAGAAGLARAADYVRAYPDQIAVLLSVELCSLTFQRDDLSVANLIAAALFGDGAAAAVIGGAARARQGAPRIVTSSSVLYSDTEDMSGWEIVDGGFKIILSTKIPEVALQHVARDVDTLRESAGIERSQVTHWIRHTGGPKVLDAIESALELPPDALQRSRRILARAGNVSSTSILLVLND